MEQVMRDVIWMFGGIIRDIGPYVVPLALIYLIWKLFWR